MFVIQDIFKYCVDHKLLTPKCVSSQNKSSPANYICHVTGNNALTSSTNFVVWDEAEWSLGPPWHHGEIHPPGSAEPGTTDGGTLDVVTLTTHWTHGTLCGGERRKQGREWCHDRIIWKVLLKSVLTKWESQLKRILNLL